MPDHFLRVEAERSPVFIARSEELRAGDGGL
jgi:hypothetical protein